MILQKIALGLFPLSGYHNMSLWGWWSAAISRSSWYVVACQLFYANWHIFGFLQVFEKFTKESTSLLDELAVINENEKSTQPDKDRYVCIISSSSTILQNVPTTQRCCFFSHLMYLFVYLCVYIPVYFYRGFFKRLVVFSLKLNLTCWCVWTSQNKSDALWDAFKKLTCFPSSAATK